MKAPAKTARVLVVEDSTTARTHLVELLRSDPAVEVVGEATNGREAVELVRRLRPSILVMDIDMPIMDGFEATKRIMVEAPTPIVIVTARHDPRDVEISLRAVRMGALTVQPKPAGPGVNGSQADASHLVTLVKALSEVKVVRRRWMPEPTAVGTEPAAPVAVGREGSVRAVAVAASTGGPAAVYRLLELLPAELAVPVLVVQHLAEGFVGGLASWLGSGTALPVKVAEHGEPLRDGGVYVAPDDRHLEVAPGPTVHLSSEPPMGGFRPSATALFASVAAAYGRAGAGVVLTGMGSDGLEGSRALQRAGGLVLAQDEKTSAVFGMPRAVVSEGIADVVGTVEELAATLVRVVPRRRRP